MRPCLAALSCRGLTPLLPLFAPVIACSRGRAYKIIRGPTVLDDPFAVWGAEERVGPINVIVEGREGEGQGDGQGEAAGSGEADGANGCQQSVALPRRGICRTVARWQEFF